MAKRGSLLCFVATLAFVLVISSLAGADLKEALVFLMTFEEGAGDTVGDGSGFGNDGEIGGGGEWIAGKFGGGFYFDGATHITVVNAAPLQSLTDPMSVGAWVSPDAITGWHSIVGMDGSAGWKMGIHSSAAVAFTTYFVKDFIAQTPIPTDEWTHVAATWDGSQAIIYINGEPDAPIAGGGVIDVADEPSLDIGWRSTTQSSLFTGGLDELFIYNRVLDEDEINNIMNKGFGDIMPVEPAGKLPSTWGGLKF